MLLYVIKHLVLLNALETICKDGLNRMLVLFFTFGMYGSFSYRCVIDINVLFKCEELIM